MQCETANDNKLISYSRITRDFDRRHYHLIIDIPVKLRWLSNLLGTYLWRGFEYEISILAVYW